MLFTIDLAQQRWHSLFIKKIFLFVFRLVFCYKRLLFTVSKYDLNEWMFVRCAVLITYYFSPLFTQMGVLGINRILKLGFSIYFNIFGIKLKCFSWFSKKKRPHFSTSKLFIYLNKCILIIIIRNVFSNLCMIKTDLMNFTWKKCSHSIGICESCTLHMKQNRVNGMEI